jgi:hypothetical protein
MNLVFAYQLLLAADEQRSGFLKVAAGEPDRQVRLMAAAGLVEATLNNDGRPGSFTAIRRLTASGRTFLRTFKDHPLKG